MAIDLADTSSTSSQTGDNGENITRMPDDDGVDDCRPSLDLASLAGGSKGTGPRLFCGHVPKEVNDEMVRQHFSKWGIVSDVYFPRHKKTLKRRPFCFVTFANKEDAERALSQSGLEIGGVPIKNLTMVEDRDKYYTNKHASARQALLQALKQLGPSAALPAHGTSCGAQTAGAGVASAEQLSNLAAIMALEGVHSDVVLQTLGLHTAAEAAAVAAAAAATAPATSAPMPGLTASALASLDRATLSSQLLHALATPSLSSQTAFDMRSSFDLSTAMRSTGNSMDLSSLQQSLAAAAVGLPLDGGSIAGRMHTADSRSTLASADWSHAPSARTSLDALMPNAGFMASPGSLGSAAGMSSMHARLSLDAAMQLQQAQQQAAAQQALLATTSRMSSSAYPLQPVLPQMAPQANLGSVMRSSFYQPQAVQTASEGTPPQPSHSEVQHSLQSVMGSGLYGGSPSAPALSPTRHSMHEFSSGGGSLLPFNDVTWAPHTHPHLQRQHQHQLGGYSTVLRPSIDRTGLPPLPPRSPNQDSLGRQSGNASPDAMMGLPAGGWPMSGRVAV